MLMAGTVMTACSSDDEVIAAVEKEAGQDVVTKGGEALLPNAADFVKVVADTGYLRYNSDEGFWCIDASLPEIPGAVYVDGGICYFMYNLPEEFMKSGLKVKFTGDAYQCKDIDKNGDGNAILLGGYEYYDVVIKDIEIVE